MAIYRQVHTSFWQDPFVLELTPEEKYFYLYLMTNTKTSACGIYELPRGIIELETGYNRETVEKLLNRFIEYGKILYCSITKEIMLLNWLKYNNWKGSKTQTCIKNELKKIKNKEFTGIVDKILCPLNGASIPLEYPMEVTRERERERERELNQEKSLLSSVEVKNISISDSDYQKLIGLVISKGAKDNDHAKSIVTNKIEELHLQKEKGLTVETNDYCYLRGMIIKEYENNRNKVVFLGSNQNNTYKNQNWNELTEEALN